MFHTAVQDVPEYIVVNHVFFICSDWLLIFALESMPDEKISVKDLLTLLLLWNNMHEFKTKDA